MSFYSLKQMSARLNLFFAAGFLWLAAMTFGSAVHAASFTASLDRDTVTLGDQATLSLKFDGIQPQDAPQIPAIPGLEVQYVGPSSAFSFINGQTSSSITYNYIVAAQHDGEFEIPAMRVKVNGQQFESRPLKLTVTKPGAPPAAANDGNAVAFMKLTLPQQKIYVGQELTAQLQIFLRDDVQNYGNLQFTATPVDGFVLGKNVGGQRYRTQIGNRAYTVVPISIALTVTKAGNLSLGPFTAGMVVVLPSQNQRGDWPFIFNQGEQKQVTLATDQIKVQSLPLPEKNRPANFNGGLASFTVTTSAGPTNLAAGDPLTVRIQVVGRGALDDVKLPEPLALKDFKIFRSTSTITNLDALGVEGTKIFELVAAPQSAEVHEWPALSLTCANSSDYFSPEDGEYHTLTSAAVPLAVGFAGSTPLPALPAAKNSAADSQTPQDIAPVKDSLGTLVTKSSPLVTRPVFLAVQTVPVLAFLAAFVWRKRADKLANNPRLRRKIAVEKMVHNGIGDLRKLAAENNSEEFFVTLFRLLQEQLGERLDCPASAITENVIEEHAVLRGTDPATLANLRELFQLCNQARYAPVRGSAELNSVAAQFEKAVGELQEAKA